MTQINANERSFSMKLHIFSRTLRPFADTFLRLYHHRYHELSKVRGGLWLNTALISASLAFKRSVQTFLQSLSMPVPLQPALHCKYLPVNHQPAGALPD